MSDLRRRIDTDFEIVYVGHNPGLVLVVILFGLGIFVAAQGADDAGAVAARRLGAAFALLGFFGLFWRDRFRLDLVRRRWERIRGYWPFLRTTAGFFDDLQRIEVVEKEGYLRGTPTVEWEVWLQSPVTAARVRVLETADEAEARRIQQELAARLGVAEGMPQPKPR